MSVIFQETEGNPFFVEEVFAHLSEEGALFDPGGRWKAERDGPGDRDRARELLGHARGIYDEVGMLIHVKIANELLDRV